MRRVHRPGNKIVINACVLYSACRCLSFLRLLKINLAPVASHAAAPAAKAHAASRADAVQRAAAFLGLLEESADAENLDKAMVRFREWTRVCIYSRGLPVQTCTQS